MTQQIKNPPVPQEFNGITLHIVPDEQHEFLLTNKEVADGYGTGETLIREHKSKHSDELIHGKHFITVRNPDGNPRAGIPHQQTLWTKRGIVRLGFFIKSERAKQFRDWAEDLVIDTLAHRGRHGNPAVQIQKLQEHNQNLQSHIQTLAAQLERAIVEIEALELREAVLTMQGEFNDAIAVCRFPHRPDVKALRSEVGRLLPDRLTKKEMLPRSSLPATARNRLLAFGFNPQGWVNDTENRLVRNKSTLAGVMLSYLDEEGLKRLMETSGCKIAPSRKTKTAGKAQ